MDYTDKSAYARGAALQNCNVATPSEETASKIRDGVTRAEEQLAALHSMISTLENRFDTVLTPVPPQPASVNQPKDGCGLVQSHLLARLHSLNNVIEEAYQRLRTLLSRAEV